MEILIILIIACCFLSVVGVSIGLYFGLKKNPKDGYWDKDFEKFPESYWSGCDKDCGYGQQQRSRICTPPENGGKRCEGEEIETRTCINKICDKDCQIDSEFTEWSQCTGIETNSCLGIQTRYKKIINEPEGSGKECPLMEDRTETRECKVDGIDCDVDCVIDDNYTEWSECSEPVSKGCYGAQKRYKPILKESRGTGQMCPSLEDRTEIKECEIEGLVCDQDCMIDENYSEWSPCSDTNASGCYGFQSRTKKIIKEQIGTGKACPSLESRTEKRACNKEGANCDKNCILGEYTEWTKCSGPAVGGCHGTQVRYKPILQEGTGTGVECPPLVSRTETQTCKIDGLVCDQDCITDENYSEWSPCSNTDTSGCNGEQVRIKQIIQEQAGAGKTCPSLESRTEKRACDKEGADCSPKDCQYITEWSGKCSQECDGGVELGNIKIINPPKYGGAECPALLYTSRQCNQQKCKYIPYKYTTNQYKIKNSNGTISNACLGTSNINGEQVLIHDYCTSSNIRQFKQYQKDNVDHGFGFKENDIDYCLELKDLGRLNFSPCNFSDKQKFIFDENNDKKLLYKGSVDNISKILFGSNVNNPEQNVFRSATSKNECEVINKTYPIIETSCKNQPYSLLINENTNPYFPTLTKI